MTFSEQKSRIEELLKNLTTAENAETVAQGVSALKAMEEEHENALKDAKAAKDALVRVVSQTPIQPTTKTQDADPTHEDAPKSLDEIVDASLAEVIANRPKA